MLSQGELVVVFSKTCSDIHTCHRIHHMKHVLVFPWDQRGLLLLGIPNLLVGDVYHVKNEGCLLEVFILRLFNRTLSIYT